MEQKYIRLPEKADKEGQAMWVIFLASASIFAMTAIVILKIGHKVYLNMKREEETFEVEKEAYKKIKKNIKEEQKS